MRTMGVVSRMAFMRISAAFAVPTLITLLALPTTAGAAPRADLKLTSLKATPRSA